MSSTDLLASLESVLAGMKPDKKAELIRVAAKKLKQKWLPNPGRQTEAYLCPAEWLLYGGAAGGGKTDLLIGTALTSHRRGLIFRRSFVDLRGAEERLLEVLQSRDGYNAQDMTYKSKDCLLEFGALEKPGSEFTWQGRPHDFLGFDEGAQLTLQKVLYVAGWLRSTNVGVRKRVIVATNPPMGGEGEWIIDFWAPWLDPAFPDPASPGELRWAIIVENKTQWVDGSGYSIIKGHHYTHESRTFIPALLDDNPYLRDTGYRGRLENLPEPLRSQLLYGDFMAGRQDHDWQVIPTSWVRAANDRWRKAEEKYRVMVALAMDVAMGGKANTSIAKLYEDSYFGPIKRIPGVAMDDPSQHAALIVVEQKDQADLSVDATGGWGIGVASHLRIQHRLEATGLVFSKKSLHKAKGGKLKFANLRAEMYWQFREALEPDSGEDVKLHPDGRVLAQLTTPRYYVRSDVIHIEDKDDIEKRVGGSVDDADAIVMAWNRRTASLRKLRDVVPGLPPVDIFKPPQVHPADQNLGWMVS